MNFMSKKQLKSAVNKNLNKLVKLIDTVAIIDILIDEIYKDFAAGKSLSVFNFGKFVIMPAKPRKHFERISRTVKISPGSNRVTFTFTNKVRKKLLQLIDLDKSFKDG